MWLQNFWMARSMSWKNLAALCHRLSKDHFWASWKLTILAYRGCWLKTFDWMSYPCLDLRVPLYSIYHLLKDSRKREKKKLLTFLMWISFYSSNMILKILILQISQKHIHPDNSAGSQKVITCFSETNSKSSLVSTAGSRNAHSVTLTLKQDADVSN